jgi:hypothetical protein
MSGLPQRDVASGTAKGMLPHRGTIDSVGLFDRFRRSRRGGSEEDTEADSRYLLEWARARTGVEAYVEPQTSVTEVTVVLVASDGEWTRRRAGGAAGARRLGEQLQIPVYDVQRVGYPQRMRDYEARRRAERRAGYDPDS